MFAFTRVCFAFIIVLSFTPKAFACGSCGCTLANLGKNIAVLQSESKDTKIYFQYLFDQTHWDKMDAREAHTIHHGGHEVHDKTTEDFHHFKIGSHLTDKLHVSLDIPYVIRRSLEVDDHAFLGNKQASQGWGDLQLIGDYVLWQGYNRSLKGVAGIQLPTGETRALNTQGGRFEPEFQPGSGAYDYIAGGIYQMGFSHSELTTNATYVVTTEGAQHFEAGDILTLSAEYDYYINPKSKNFRTSVGVDMVYQFEQEDKFSGEKSPDSGGHVMLAGPVVKMRATDHLSVVGSVLFPVYQQLGGVHQEMAYEWTLAAQIGW
jgi:hypothetical protein